MGSIPNTNRKEKKKQNVLQPGNKHSALKQNTLTIWVLYYSSGALLRLFCFVFLRPGWPGNHRDLPVSAPSIPRARIKGHTTTSHLNFSLLNALWCFLLLFFRCCCEIFVCRDTPRLSIKLILNQRAELVTS